jgi:hypothetical protein
MDIDPMADAAEQQGLSPYHAMACNPSTMTDPLGLAPQYTVNLSNPNVNMAPAGLGFVEEQAIMFGTSLLGRGVSDMMRSIQNTMDEVSKAQQIKALWNMIVMTYGDGSNMQARTLFEAIQSGEAMIKGGKLIFTTYHNVPGETKMVYDPDAGMPEGMQTYDSDITHKKETFLFNDGDPEPISEMYEHETAISENATVNLD